MKKQKCLWRFSNLARVSGSTQHIVAPMKCPAGQAPAATRAMHDVPGKQRSKE